MEKFKTVLCLLFHLGSIYFKYLVSFGSYSNRAYLINSIFIIQMSQYLLCLKASNTIQPIFSVRQLYFYNTPNFISSLFMYQQQCVNKIHQQTEILDKNGVYHGYYISNMIIEYQQQTYTINYYINGLIILTDHGMI